jgi:HK97 family phage major capsid protein
MDKIRKALDDTIAQAEEMTTRDNFDPKDPGYVALREEADRLTASYQEMAAWSQRKATSNEVGAALHRTEAKADKEQTKARTAEPLSMGEEFIRSEVFTNYAGRGTSSRVEVVRDRALPGTLADWAGALPSVPQRDVTPPAAATSILDLVPSIPVSQNSLETIVYGIAAGGATVVAEGSAKPSIEFEPTVTPITLATLAVYTQLTRQMIEDGPAVKARIDQMLARDVRREAEDQAAAALAGATLPTAEGDTLLAAIRKGMAAVQTAGYAPGAVLLNPNDYAELDIDVFGATLNGPSVNSRFWGLTPVPHAAQAAGTATVGDFGVAVERYVRTGINLYITDSHGDTFLSNVFTLLAEAREKAVVVRPAALVECTAVAGP